MKTILIKNGLVVTEKEASLADIYIEDGLIANIAPDLRDLECDYEIDASDLFILPGGIDAHTHMNLPVMGINASDDFFTGTRAALMGGTTTIIDFANQVKGDSLFSAYNKWREMADQNVTCDYALHVSVTDVNDDTLKEVTRLFEEEGVSSFKTFLAYDTMKLDLASLERLMLHVARLGGIITTHSEIGEMISQATKKQKDNMLLSPASHPLSHPEIAEITATKTMIELAIKTNCPVYFVHVSSALALEQIIEAKKKYPKLFAESCPQYLFLDESHYIDPFEESSKFVMSPPLRSGQIREQLWHHYILRDIDVIATDHCPFWLKDKKMGENDFTKIPNGAPGVEDRIKLLFSESVMNRQMNIVHFAKMISTNPAKLFGLYPQKGTIKIGSDADLILIDPSLTDTISTATHNMRVDYNCYEGKKLQGKIQTVILKGSIVVNDNKFVGSKRDGNYLKRHKPNMELYERKTRN